MMLLKIGKWQVPQGVYSDEFTQTFIKQPFVVSNAGLHSETKERKHKQLNNNRVKGGPTFL